MEPVVRHVVESAFDRLLRPGYPPPAAPPADALRPGAGIPDETSRGGTGVTDGRRRREQR